MKESREYYEKLKNTLPDVLAAYLEENPSHRSMDHLVSRLTIAAIDFVVKRGGVINPPQIKNRVLTAMYLAGPKAYKRYVLQQCQ